MERLFFKKKSAKLFDFSKFSTVAQAFIFDRNIFAEKKVNISNKILAINFHHFFSRFNDI